MSYKTEFIPGQHNVVCAICQSYFKSNEVRRNWSGVLVCEKDYDPMPITLLPQIQLPDDPKPVGRPQGNDTLIEYTSNAAAGIVNDIWVTINS